MHSSFEKLFAVGKYLPHVYGTSWCGFIHGLRKGQYTIEPRGISNLTFRFEIRHFAFQKMVCVILSIIGLTNLI